MLMPKVLYLCAVAQRYGAIDGAFVSAHSTRRERNNLIKARAAKSG